MKNIILFQSRGHYDETIYANVPDELFARIKDLSEKHGVLSDAMDIDETDALSVELAPYKVEFLNVCEYC